MRNAAWGMALCAWLFGIGCAVRQRTERALACSTRAQSDCVRQAARAWDACRESLSARAELWCNEHDKVGPLTGAERKLYRPKACGPTTAPDACEKQMTIVKAARSSIECKGDVLDGARWDEAKLETSCRYALGCCDEPRETALDACDRQAKALPTAVDMSPK